MILSYKKTKPALFRKIVFCKIYVSTPQGAIAKVFADSGWSSLAVIGKIPFCHFESIALPGDKKEYDGGGELPANK